MERFLLEDIPMNITWEDIAKRLHVTEEDDLKIVCELFEKAKSVAKPKALYKVAYVDKIEDSIVVLDGVEFKSKILAQQIGNVHRVFAYVVTCGREVEEWSHSESDYILSLWADTIKEAFLIEARIFFVSYIKEKYGLSKLSFINPGSGDVDTWPIAEQVPLFSLIGDVTETCGVVLKESFLLIPIKSISGLVFPSDREFVNCSLCHRENCPGRKVPLNDSEMSLA
jgi:hypothetical protein